MSDQHTVVLGVTGGIAAYKAADLVRRMRARGWRVKVVMTAAATQFITPLTLQTLSGEPVATELFAPAKDGPLPHLSIADEADCILVAPATANFLGKLARGVADDLLTTAALATRAPIVVAPAMNTKMWTSDATRANVAILEGRGVTIVAPGAGELACGESGEGRLADLAALLDAVAFELDRRRALSGRRIVVSAGGTREPLDPVRFIGNRSSGRMGYALADEAARMGADVTLVSASTRLPRPYGVKVVPATTAMEMREALTDAMARDAVGPAGAGEALPATGSSGAAPVDALIMAAAVADYRPAETAAGKIKKGPDQTSLALVRNPDILAEIGTERASGGAGPRILVGFAAETASGDDLVAAARSKLEEKHLDLVVANDVTEPGAGFDVDTNRVVVVSAGGTAEWLGPAAKRVIAREILMRIAAALESRP